VGKYIKKLSGDHEARIAQDKKLLKSYRDETPGSLLMLSIEQHRTISAEILQLSHAQATFSPDPDEWSILEVCSHLSHSVRNTALLVKAMLRGRAPEIPGGIRPGMFDESIVSVEESINGMQKGFAALPQAMERFDDDWDETIVMEHPWLGPMNAKEWVAFNLLHVRVHIDQINRIKKNENSSTT